MRTRLIFAQAVTYDVVGAISIGSVDEENWLSVTFIIKIISHTII